MINEILLRTKKCYELRLSFHLKSIFDKLRNSVLLDSLSIKRFYSDVKKQKNNMKKGGYYVKKKGENQKPSP